jgi:hypothetical protein
MERRSKKGNKTGNWQEREVDLERRTSSYVRLQQTGDRCSFLAASSGWVWWVHLQLGGDSADFVEILLAQQPPFRMQVDGGWMRGCVDGMVHA